MTVVVVDEFETVHINEGNKEFLIVVLAAREDIIGNSDKAVSVVDIAERVYYVQLIKLLYHALEVNELAYILDRVAYAEHESMAQKIISINRYEIAVLKYDKYLFIIELK